MSLDVDTATVFDRSEPLMAEEMARMLRRLTLAVSMVLTGALVAGAPAAPAAPSCLNTMPVADVTAGMTTHGLTVSHGKTPEPFTADVLGVLKDGVAPGVDMIIVEADSAALDKAGGIWAGMSGSPVYADSDNRLLGAVAYGLSFGPSKIGGLAAAEDMDKVLQLPTQPAAPRTVPLTKALKAKIIARGDATARELSGGLQQLPLPLSVSGLRGSRLGAFAGRLSGAERFVPFNAGTIPSSAADIADIVPGSNFAAALSYGDVAAAGVGTTTGVCADHVVAFGHPMNFDGPSGLSAHTADAITIQDDSLGSPFKLANVGGTVGTLDQDRLSGIRAILGAAPDPIDVTSDVDDGAVATRHGVTEINRTTDSPDIAAFHLIANIDRVIDRVGGGTAALGWTVTGTAGGEHFSFSRNNRFADPQDISFSSADELFFDLLSLTDNPFTDVKFTDIKMDATVKAPFRQYRVTGLQRFQGGAWVTVSGSDSLVLTPGVPLRVRVLLANFRTSTPVAPVELTFPVAADASGDGSLDILAGGDGGGGGDDGGGSGGGDTGEPTSFKDLLKSLGAAPRNDELDASLSMFGSGSPDVPSLLDTSSPAPVNITKRLAEVVTGSLSVSVTIPSDDGPEQPSEPPTLSLGGKSTLKLATALRKGLHMTVESSAPGRLVARATVDKKTAHRLHLKKPVVAAVTKVIGDGRSHVTLKFTKNAKKHLRHAKRVKLSLRATVTDLDGNRAVDHTKLVLKRRLH
jgi:hypothetical protein